MPSDNIKNENPGVVLSDSLAAESIRDGGTFGANSNSRGPSLQASSSTTTNTTDVSNATELPPAPNAHARFLNEDFDANAELDAGRGQGKDAGRGPTWNIPSTGTQETLADVTNTTRPKGQDLQDRPKGQDLQDGPKGHELQDGGFDSGPPNASFTTDIGGKGDPGRVTLQQMERMNASAAGGAGPVQTEVTNDGQYDILKETSA